MNEIKNAIDSWERLSLIELWQACDQNAMQLMNLISEFIGRRTGHVNFFKQLEAWRDQFHSCALYSSDCNKNNKIENQKIGTDKITLERTNNSKQLKFSKNLKIANLEKQQKNTNTLNSNGEEINNDPKQRNINTDNKKINLLTSNLKKNCNENNQLKNCYNGSNIYNTDKTLLYSWSQNIFDLDITIPLPKNILSKKQCKVSIDSENFKVELIDDNIFKVILQEKLTFPVKKDCIFWTLEPGNCLRVWLEKKQESWWTSLLQNEPKLDIDKLEKTVSYHDLSLNEQSMIQNLSLKQIQKK